MENLKYFPILMYHLIVERKNARVWDNFCLEPAELAAQLDYLVRKKFTAINFADLESILQGSRLCPQKPVMITFDDAYFESLKNAAPLLEARNLKGIFSIVTDYIGKENKWQKANATEMTASRENIVKYKGPFISFESHSAKHSHLPRLAPEEIERDMSNSKEVIENITGEKVRAIFYPYGSFNENVKKAAAKAGYKYGLAIAASKRSVTEDLLEMRRVYIKSSDSIGAFKRKVSSWYIYFRGIREAVRHKRGQP